MFLRSIIAGILLFATNVHADSIKIPFFRAFPAESQKHGELPLVVIIPSYKNEKWCMYNLASVFAQHYQNYRVIYINDCSPDGTGAEVERIVDLLGQRSRCTIIHNVERHGALANLHAAITSCDDHEVAVLLDGDDWFAHTNVLNHVNNAYWRGAWLTHGHFMEYPSSYQGWSQPMPRSVVEHGSYRQHTPHASHLRTFYVWLYKKIKLEDLLDSEGNFFVMTWDQAMMFPMLEMAAERHEYFSEVTYIYNVANVLNDNKVNAQLQRDLEAYIRSQPHYARLDSSEAPQFVREFTR